LIGHDPIKLRMHQLQLRHNSTNQRRDVPSWSHNGWTTTAQWHRSVKGVERRGRQAGWQDGAWRPVRGKAQRVATAPPPSTNPLPEKSPICPFAHLPLRLRILLFWAFLFLLGSTP
jgi:hypothetical protein